MRSPWLVLVLFGLPHVARATPREPERAFNATMAYSAPAACPSVEEFKTVVTGRLGFDPFTDDAADHVLVFIERGAETLDGRLEWRDREGHWAGDRTFTVHTSDCAELVRTMGFALAVQINLLATERAPGTQGEASRDRSAEATPRAEPARSAAPAAADARPATDSASARPVSAGQAGAGPAFEVGVGGAVAVGMSPGAVGLARLFAGAAWGRWAVELGGELSTKAVEQRADGAGYAERFFLASAAGCWSPEPLGLCVLTKAGSVHVEGRDIDVPASPSGAAVQLGARVRLRQRLGHGVFLAERLDGLFNLTRWRVTLDQIPVWTAPVVAGSLGLELGAVF